MAAANVAASNLSGIVAALTQVEVVGRRIMVVATLPLFSVPEGLRTATSIAATTETFASRVSRRVIAPKLPSMVMDHNDDSSN